MLYLLYHGHLTKLDVNGRARRLMMKIIKTTPVMPRSLFVTGIRMKDKGEYVGGGGFGHVFKGKLGGQAVALKLLFKTQNNIVSCRPSRDTISYILMRTGFLPGSVDVEISQA